VLTQALDVANATVTRRIIGLGWNIDETVSTGIAKRIKGLENMHVHQRKSITNKMNLQ
jgi:hypothetical protein